MYFDYELIFAVLVKIVPNSRLHIFLKTVSRSSFFLL